MTDEENRKLAEWAGFKWDYSDITNIGWYINGIFYGTKLPDFTDPTTCFKWIWPELKRRGYKLMLETLDDGELEVCVLGKPNEGLLVGKHENPAEALCQAVLKLLGDK